MTPLLPLGLAIVANVTFLGASIFRFKRQVRRVAAERAAEYRGLFRLEPLPPPGEEVQILVEEDDGKVSELDAVHWPHLGWTDAVTLLRVEDDVLGWRRHPFRAPARDPREHPRHWPREKLAAELAKLAPDGPPQGAGGGK